MAASLLSDSGVQAEDHPGARPLPGPSAAPARVPRMKVLRAERGWLEVRRDLGERTPSVVVVTGPECPASEPSCDLLARGEFSAVAEAWRARARVGEDGARLRGGLGTSLYLEGDLLGALRVFTWAASDHPLDPHVQNGLGNVLSELGVWTQARAEFSSLAREPGFAAVAHHNLGNALRAAEQPREALREYARALDLEPGLAVAHFNRGLVLLELDQAGAAAEAFRAATERQPALADGYLYEGVARLRTQDTIRATIALHRAEDLAGPSPAVDLALGLACQRLGMHSESVRRLERALPHTPRDARVLRLLASSLIQASQSVRAEEVLEEAFALEPPSADGHFAQGLRLLLIDRSAGATRHLKQALALGRRQADTYFALGEALSRQEELEPAVEALLEASRLSPGSAAIQFSLGVTLRRQGDGQGALRAFLEARGLDPGDPEHHTALLEQQQRMGDFAGCAETGRGVVDRFPRELAARFETAFCLAVVGELALAAEHLESGLDQDTEGDGVLALWGRLERLTASGLDLAGLWLLKGMIHERRGDWHRAIQAFERLARSHPPGDWVRQARARIHRLAPVGSAAGAAP
jgi:tetratricopeptide (TPR) repeat protein